MALLDLNTTAFPVALFGAAAAGVPLAPLNYRLAEDRLTEAVSRLSPVALFRGAGIANTVALGPSDVLRPTADLLAAGLDSGPEVDTDLAAHPYPARLLFPRRQNAP